MATSDVNSGPAWIVVTGASRGLGAAFCMALAERLGPGSRIVGLARSREGLLETASKVEKANPQVKFLPVVLDLGTATQGDLEAALKEGLDPDKTPGSPVKALMIHNAGSLGHLQHMKDLQDLQHNNDYFRLNVSSVISLNAIFLSTMKKDYPKACLEVVNITSLCAVQPFKSWGLYCAGKAARDMLFQVLAAEDPSITVLNYAPGPLDNDMQATARTATGDEELRSAFISMKEEGKLLTMEDSVKKFLQIWDQRKFKSGDHVDYFDE
ncbi:hypothetical protein SK128_009240 [Halocaridina rubra]|uniref:Sepiapterin reductase n=1 Tax=Halocaridina rubra TaxID=373956 RepID=A0AAN8XRS7_HALRR